MWWNFRGWWMQVLRNDNWQQQSHNVRNKVSSTLGFLRKNLKHSKQLKQHSYIAVVGSIQLHNMWPIFNTIKTSTMYTILSRAAWLIIDNTSYESSLTCIFTPLGWLHWRIKGCHTCPMFPNCHIVAVTKVEFLVVREKKNQIQEPHEIQTSAVICKGISEHISPHHNRLKRTLHYILLGAW